MNIIYLGQFFIYFVQRFYDEQFSRKWRYHTTKVVCKSATSTGRSGTAAPDGAPNTVSIEEAVQQSHQFGVNGNLAVLEGSCQVDGSCGVNQREISKDISRGNRHLLGEGYQGNTIKLIPPLHARGHNGAGDGGIGTISCGSPSGPKDMQNAGKRNGQPNTKRSRKRIWYPLHQEGRDNIPISASRQRPPTLIGSTAPYKTSEYRKPVAVQCQPNHDGTRSRDPKSVGTPPGIITATMIEQCYTEVPYLKRHSLLCTRRSSKPAKGVDFEIPLHVKPDVPILDVQELRQRMSSAADTRFEEVWSQLLCMPARPEEPPRVKSGLSSNDYDLLVQHGIVAKLSPQDVEARPSVQFLIPFTVIETDDQGNKRRRFISWTRSDNDRLRTYEPNVPLWHPSKYLHRVTEESGVKRECGFCQVEIPQASRQKFRFLSDNGDVYYPWVTDAHLKLCIP